ncbi:MAG: hypothetical protein RLY86_3348 [Pseudomonadota bacterium]|jgi:TRAP-type mannitol/chloroaromatic compound transport system permease small subunit
MDVLRRFVAVVDGLNDWIGRVVAWLTLGTVLSCFTVVVLRYGFNTGQVWMQDLYVWLHAIVFMLGAGYTFLHGGHVRVDILYGKASARRRAWIDIFGTLVFLMPWLIVLAWTSQHFVLSSWSIREPSAQSGGLPGAYLMKTLIWVFCALVGLQGLALIARRLLFLGGDDRHAPAAGH